MTWRTPRLIDESRLLSILRIGHDTSMRGAGLSLREALVRTHYATLRSTFDPRDLIPLIKRNPTLIDQWVAYSEDKRTSGGWYLTERGEIGTLDDPDHQMRFDSMEEAVAEYVVRELDHWARVAGAG